MVGASHNPRMGIVLLWHGDGAMYARFLLVILEQKIRMMTVGSCDARTALHGYRKVVAQYLCSACKMAQVLSSHRVAIARRLHHDRVAALRCVII